MAWHSTTEPHGPDSIFYLNAQNLGKRGIQCPRLSKFHELEPTAKFQESSLKKRGHQWSWRLSWLQNEQAMNTDVKEPRQVMWLPWKGLSILVINLCPLKCHAKWITNQCHIGHKILGKSNITVPTLLFQHYWSTWQMPKVVFLKVTILFLLQSRWKSLMNPNESK